MGGSGAGRRPRRRTGATAAAGALMGVALLAPARASSGEPMPAPGLAPGPVAEVREVFAALAAGAPDRAQPAAAADDTGRFLRAEAALALGLWAEAESLLQGLEHRLPEVQDLIAQRRAEAARARGDWEAARVAWGQVRQRSPSTVLRGQAAYGLADAEFALGRRAQATAAYQVAIAQPIEGARRPSARFNLAELALARGDLAEAVRLWVELCYRGRDDTLALAAARRLEELPEEQRGGRLFRPRLERIDRLIRMRALEAAQQQLAMLAELASGDEERALVVWRQGQLSLRRGEGRAAAARLAPLLRRGAWPQRLAVARDWAQAMAQDGQAGRGASELARLGRQHARAPEGRDAWYRAAQIAQEEGQHALGLSLYTSLLKHEPRFAQAEEARWRAGWCAYRLGDHARAAPLFAAAERLASSRVLRERARYWRGRLAMQAGQAEHARQLLTPLAASPGLYYGLWARARLRELGGAARAAPPGAPLVWVAAAEVAPPTPPAPLPARLQLALSALVLAPPQRARLETLLLLGQQEELARLVLGLPSVPGRPRAEVTLARAQLAELTGNLTTAYRLVSVAYVEALAAPPSAASAPVFALAFPAIRAELVGQAAQRSGTSRALLWALMRQESSFDENALSGADAQGLMQIIPATGRRIAQALGHAGFSASDLMRPHISIPYGAWYLARLKERYSDHTALVAAAYNAGPRAVDAWLRQRGPLPTDVFIEDIPFRETRLYAKNGLVNLAAYHALYEGGDLLLPARVALPARGARRGVDF